MLSDMLTESGIEPSVPMAHATEPGYIDVVMSIQARFDVRLVSFVGVVLIARFFLHAIWSHNEQAPSDAKLPCDLTASPRCLKAIERPSQPRSP